MWPMIIAAGIGAAGSIASGIIGKKAAEKAARQQMEFQQRGIDSLTQQREGFLTDRDKMMSEFRPSIDSGDAARSTMEGYLGLKGTDAQRDLFQNFQYDPGYQHQVDQGTRAIEGSRAASGLLRSGGTVRTLGEFGFDKSNEYYRQRMADLGAMETAGRGSLQTMAQVNQGYLAPLASMSGSIAGMYAPMGTAAASGTIGAANATTGAIQGVANSAGYLAGSFGGPTTPANSWAATVKKAA